MKREIYYDHRHSSTYYTYIKFKHVLKYYYNLDTIGNVNHDILTKAKIKEIIDRLSKIKFINVSIVNNRLVVEKEAVLYGYNQEEVVYGWHGMEHIYDGHIEIEGNNTKYVIHEGRCSN